MTLRTRAAPGPWIALAAASWLAAGCASLRLGGEQNAYFRGQLDAYRYGAGCLDVWPSVLKLLGSKGYPLQGRDRQYAGQGKESALGAFVDQGGETSAVEGGGLFVRTGWLPASEGRSRYEVTASPGQPSGCSITFTRISSGTIDPASDQREVDWKIQLELVKQVEPSSAARIEAGAPR
jgi:hypothetical protein